MSGQTPVIIHDAVVACHECDLLHQVHDLPPKGVAKCRRCGGTLYRDKPDSLDRALTMTITGLILYVVANSYPFLSFRLEALVQETTLVTGVKLLYQSGMWEIALLVALTAVILPLVQLLGMLYVLLPLRLGFVPPHMAGVFRIVRSIQPWSMMEVFMLGILASVVKLASMASIVPGLSLYAFALLIVVLAASSASLDPRIVWERLNTRL